MYSGKKVHIVSFDIPDPPSYGGVIDVFFKIKSLAAIGVEVILHCWQYGQRKPSAELTKYCAEVHYYARNRYKSPFTGKIPYIVKTRNSPELVSKINKDSYPVLFEGLHTTAPLYFQQLSRRKTFIRNHNIETDYYRNLADQEKSFLRRQYFIQEAKWLETYQEVMSKCDRVFAISPNDHQLLSKEYSSAYIPAFHPNNGVTALTGVGKYCFYHGNLSVAENDEAGQFLVAKVFSQMDAPLIIGGNQASAKLKSLVAQYPNVELKENLSIQEFDLLMRDASINVLPTFQATGIKLKLLNALYKGRHCVVNGPMISNTGLENLCHIANSPEEFVSAVKGLINIPFSQSDIEQREEVLGARFDNHATCMKLADQMFNT